MIRRRQFITLLGGAAAAWPLAARAQQAALPVIGYLRVASRTQLPQIEAAFREGLGSMGFREGINVATDYRFASYDYDRLPTLAADLVRSGVAVLHAGDTPAAVAAKAATTNIPIIFRIGGDPVQLGLVKSPNQPGGNITGVTFLATVTSAIRLQMLHEAVPGAAIVGLLVNPSDPRSMLPSRHWWSGGCKRLSSKEIRFSLTGDSSWPSWRHVMGCLRSMRRASSLMPAG